MGKHRLGTKNYQATNANQIWLDEDLLYLLLNYKKLSVRYKPDVCFDMIGRELGRSVKACASQLSLLRTGKTKINMLPIQIMLEDVSSMDDFTIPEDDTADEVHDPVISVVPNENYADLDAAQDFIRNMFGQLNQTVQTLEALNDKLIADNEHLTGELEAKTSNAEDLQLIEKLREEIATLEQWLREEQAKTHGLTEENIRHINEIERLKRKLSTVLNIRHELEQDLQQQEQQPGIRRVK
ncbi:hypothetical protein GZH47_33515 (plasmid) [Paenibacillus rhizovicinus]|uniref:Uncharacterized protein n=1 Tax=Paenibacillus rhizovicinus TaxID=2704463 RepID=A0A6C0PCL4_9BACL|nr:hypothetical protein [Paenibacillus rhizovicinus]QHW35813.1 hypothetical protein GZH47_33515 [Paenibacillus rhizovicinus]